MVAELLATAQQDGYVVIPAKPLIARQVEKIFLTWCVDQRQPAVCLRAKPDDEYDVTLDLLPTGYAHAFPARAATDAVFIHRITQRFAAADAANASGGGRAIITAIGPVSILYGVSPERAARQLARDLVAVGRDWLNAYQRAAPPPRAAMPLVGTNPAPYPSGRTASRRDLRSARTTASRPSSNPTRKNFGST
jgi:hypothetical protein